MKQRNKVELKHSKFKNITLNWATNKFNFDKLQAFQDEIFKKGSELRSLIINLRESNVDQIIFQSLTQEISKIEILESIFLNLISCKILCYESLQKLLECQSNLLSMKLEFGAINMINDEVQFISKGLISQLRLKQLQLKLCGCSLRDQGTQLLMEGISQLSSLEHLDLDISENKIGSQGGLYLSQGLSKLSNLNILKINLTGNQSYTSNFLVNFIDGLVLLKNLSEFDLILSSQYYRTIPQDQHSLTVVLFEQFFKKLSMLQSLKILKIEAPNDIFNQGINCLNFRESILSLKSLKVLKVEQFSYYQENLNILVQDLENHKNLIYLYVNTVNIIGSKFKQIHTLKKALRLVYFNRK